MKRKSSSIAWSYWKESRTAEWLKWWIKWQRARKGWCFRVLVRSNGWRWCWSFEYDRRARLMMMMDLTYVSLLFAPVQLILLSNGFRVDVTMTWHRCLKCVYLLEWLTNITVNQVERIIFVKHSHLLCFDRYDRGREREANFVVSSIQWNRWRCEIWPLLDQMGFPSADRRK